MASLFKRIVYSFGVVVEARTGETKSHTESVKTATRVKRHYFARIENMP